MKDGPRPVPWIADLQPATHGAFDASAAAARGITADQMLDFSANGNVIGPPPGVAWAIKNVDLSRYPDRGARGLRRAIAEREGVAVENVVVGNGSSELIWTIPRAYLSPGATAAVLSPTYGEYEVASQAVGARVERWPAYVSSACRWELDRPVVLQGLGERRPSLVWICHPNNPTGQPFPVDWLSDLTRGAPECLFVVDEAYLTLSEGLASALPDVQSGRVVVVRSLTKDMALAGVRVGYALSSAEIADILRRVLPPWNVSAVAQAAGLAALVDSEHLARAREAVAESRAHLLGGLERLGLHPYPSVANFVLVPVGSGSLVANALLDQCLAVRDCASFGLPDCIRIGVRSIPEQQRLLDALAEVCDG